LFFALHILTISFFTFYGFAEIINYSCKWTIIFSILFGFIATFFLAWTEELIFRGTLYQMFAQNMCPFYASAAASFIFMLAHDLSNPLNLITINWKLGLGLFLLGWLINIIFILTGKLYTGMGAHAGLVFVKVILRRIKIVAFLPATQLPFWVNADLRQSVLIHIFFALIIIILILLNRQKLFQKKGAGD
jgi:membrane protease YdiL (CAAX protease family)